MTREESLQFLDQKYDELINWLSKHNDDDFELITREGKWTAGQHLEHLILTTKPINQALRLPKIALKLKFGICNREERSVEEYKAKYKDKLATSYTLDSSSFDPRTVKNSEKGNLMNKFEKERQRLKTIVQKWSEKDLSKYVLPHPLLGKMTIRELLNFVAFHAEHHLNTLKKYH